MKTSCWSGFLAELSKSGDVSTLTSETDEGLVWREYLLTEHVLVQSSDYDRLLERDPVLARATYPAKLEIHQQKRSIVLDASGSLASLFADQLKHMGIPHTSDPKGLNRQQAASVIPSTLMLVIRDARHDECFLEATKLAKANNFVCVTAWIEDGNLCVGPFFVPRENACYRCMTYREFSGLKHLAEHRAWIAHQELASQAPFGSQGLIQTFAVGILAAYATAFYAGRDDLMPYGRFVVGGSLPVSVTHHELLPVAGCPACNWPN